MGRTSRVALVTGGRGGIGAATARLLAGRGYRVAVNDIVGGHQIDALVAEIGGRAFVADMASAVAVRSMVDAVEKEIGPIDVAVSNAGIYEPIPLAAIDEMMWSRMVRIHLGGAFNLARALVPRMRERNSGSLVAVASELALTGGLAGAHYMAAKAALIGFAKSLARECAPSIRVNVVAPGPVDTTLLPAEERTIGSLAAIPLGRLGRPTEIARAIVDLAEAQWTTGAVYSPNGGLVIQ